MAATTIDEALCIRQWEWSETSQTVALFTRDHGVVRALAKGSRRPKGPYSGGVELLTRAEAGLIVRPQSELALLTYWDLRQTFPALRTVLAAHNAGLYIADMLMQFVRDHDPHPALYGATVTALERMQTAATVPSALLGFQWALLVEAGYRPQLEADVRTGEALSLEAELVFHPELGGVIDPAAGDETVGARAGAGGGGAMGGWRVRAETIQLLREAEHSPSLAVAAPEATVERANRLLASYARYVLGYQTDTMTVVFGDRLAR